MLKTAKTTLIYLLVLCLSAAVAAAVRTVALITELDDALIYYESELLINVSAIIIAAFSVFAVTYVFVQDKGFKPAISFENPQTYIPSGLVGVAFLFMGTKLWGDLFSEFGKSSGVVSSTGISTVILFLVALFAIISAANFFLNCFYEKRENSVRAAFCLCCAIYMGLYSGHLFFSSELPINAPNKAIDQLAYLLLAIFFLFETRISLGRAKWRPYVAFGLIASTVAFYSSIPAIIFYFVTGKAVSNSIAENVLTLTLGIYVISRLTLSLTSVRDEMCPITRAISDATSKREAQIAERDNAHGAIVASDGDEEEKSGGSIGENYEIDFFAFSDTAKTDENDQNNPKE